MPTDKQAPVHTHRLIDMMKKFNEQNGREPAGLELSHNDELDIANEQTDPAVNGMLDLDGSLAKAITQSGRLKGHLPNLWGIPVTYDAPVTRFV